MVKKFQNVDFVIRDTSPTYQGFGFENAFNGMPHKGYVAGIEGEKVAWINIELKQDVPLSGISICWESHTNFA